MYNDTKVALDRLMDGENWGGQPTRIEKVKMVSVVVLLLVGALILN